MSPLVSVLIPCYEHADVLPWALASLVAQTHTRWEAIVVDDGSTDSPRTAVDAVADARIRFVRLDTNHGPAFARQTALDHATGDLVALQDADDWSYPDRLAAQVRALQETPAVDAVGTGMAIVGRDNSLRGVRGAREDRGACGVVRALPSSCGQATVMLRGPVARAGRFDPALRRAEDVDYLAGVLSGRRYRVLAGPLYAYRSPRRSGSDILLQAHAQRRQRLRKLIRRHPLRAGIRILDSHAKSGVYGTAHRLGLADALERLRTRPATEVQRERFTDARSAVEQALAPGAEGGAP